MGLTVHLLPSAGRGRARREGPACYGGAGGRVLFDPAKDLSDRATRGLDDVASGRAFKRRPVGQPKPQKNARTASPESRKAYAVSMKRGTSSAESLGGIS